MNSLFKIEAEIKINEEGSRTWPIKTGYRPGFNFIDEKQTSGSIDLLDKEDLKPGEHSIVEICFVSDVLLGNIKPGTEFKFYEGPVEIGSGKVLNVIGWIENP
jgi:translation elongation factor EF-Tu-like GTPase